MEARDGGSISRPWPLAPGSNGHPASKAVAATTNSRRAIFVMSSSSCLTVVSCQLPRNLKKEKNWKSFRPKFKLSHNWQRLQTQNVKLIQKVRPYMPKFSRRIQDKEKKFAMPYYKKTQTFFVNIETSLQKQGSKHAKIIGRMLKARLGCGWCLYSIQYSIVLYPI